MSRRAISNTIKIAPARRSALPGPSRFNQWINYITMT